MPRLDINGHLVDFEKMPTDAEIDEVASTLPSRSVTTSATSTAAPQPTPQEAPVDHSLGAAMYRRGIEQPMAAVAAAPGAAYELGKDWLVRGSFPPNSYEQAQESIPHAFGALGVTAPLGAPIDAAVGAPVEAMTGSQTAGDVASFVANLAAPLVAGKLASVFRNVPAPEIAPATQAVSAAAPVEAAVAPTVEAATGAVSPAYGFADVAAMDPAELRQAATAAKAYESTATVDVFGEDGARRYAALQRTANSLHDTTRADAASAEIQAIESQLTPAQQSRLFGIGEQGYNAEDLGRFADAAEAYSPPMLEHRTVDDLKNVVGRELLERKPGEDPESALRLNGAIGELSRRGYGKDVLMASVRQRAARQGYNPADAEEILQSKLAELQRPPAEPRPQAQIAQAVESVGPATPPPNAAPTPPTAADTAGAAAFRKVSAPPAAADIPPAGPMSPERIDRAMFDRLYADLPGPTRSAMFQVAQDNAEAIAAQSRGTQSIERTRALAQHLEVPLDRVLPKGSAQNAERSQALIDTLGATQEKVDRIAAQVAGGQDDIRTKMALSVAQSEHQVVLTSLFGSRAETGRALNIYKYQRQAMQLDDLKVMSQAQKLGADPGKVAELLSQLPADDTIGRFRMLRDLNKPGFMDYVRSYYLTNILSGPRTHERNIVGNASNAAYKLSSTPFAATGDYLASAMTGSPREVFMGEIPHQWYGATTGMGEGFRKALFFLKEGFAPDMTIGGADKIPQEIPGGLATNFIGRSLGAMDQFFETIAANTELHAAAYAQAREDLMAKGLMGQDLTAALPDAVSELIDAKPRSLMDQVAKYSERTVYHEDPGKTAGALYKLRDAIRVPIPAPYRKPGNLLGLGVHQVAELKPMEYVLPFIKTPANIMKQGFQASPVGFFTKAGRATGRMGAQARGEAALGSALLSFPAWLAATGRLSGSGPKDPGKVDALRATGWQPNSVRIPLPDALVDSIGAQRSPEGEYWVNYSSLQPLAVPFAAVANGFETAAELKSKGKPVSFENAAGIVMGKVANTTLQQSYLQGAFAISNMLSDPDRYGQQFVTSLAQGFVPLSGAVRTMAQAQDNAVRQPEGISEQIQTGIPGMQENVPPRLRATGEPVMRTSSPLAIPEISPVRPDPMRQELLRLDIPLSPGQPGEDISAFGQKIPLTREDDFFLRQAKGQTVRKVVTGIMQTPQYQQAPDPMKKMLLERAIGSARNIVQTNALMQKLQRKPLTPEGLAVGGLF